MSILLIVLLTVFAALVLERTFEAVREDRPSRPPRSHDRDIFDPHIGWR